MAKGKKVHEGGPPPSPGVSPTQEGQEFAKPKKAKHSKRGPSAIDLDLDTAPDSTSDQASKVKPDMDTGQNDAEDLIAKSTPFPPPPPENLPERKVIRNLWNVCCNEIAQEHQQFEVILQSLGLPSLHYVKDKTFPMTDYETAPDLEESPSKDFLDFYVFPVLLPAIQSLLEYARNNAAFSVRLATFDALDYIVSYLYNNNPRYPLRQEMPSSLEDILFVQEWLSKYPRPRPPKWMTMSKDDAARIIQRYAKGFLTRKRGDVQEMRQFWATLRKEAESTRIAQLTAAFTPKTKMTMSRAAEIIQAAVRGFLVRHSPAIARMRERLAKVKVKLEQEHQQRSRPADAEEADHPTDEEITEYEGQIEGYALELGLKLPSSSSDDPHPYPGPGGDVPGSDPDFRFTHSETCVICAKLREFIQIEEIKAELLAAKAAAAVKDDNPEESVEEEGDEGHEEQSDADLPPELAPSPKKKSKKKRDSAASVASSVASKISNVSSKRTKSRRKK